MTKQGVPEKTDSVKVAEKQHELAKEIADVKAKVQYVAPYTTYAHAGFPYVHHPVAAHISPSVKLTLKPTQQSSTTLMEPTDLYTHTLPPTLDTHTHPLLLDTHTPLVTPTAPHMFTILESVKPTAMPLFTTKPTDTATEPHTPTTPSHTEMFTDGTELLRRT